MTEVEAARHATERGLILRTLMEDYASEMTSIRSLGLAMDTMGYALSPQALEFHLVYLSQQDYVRIWRAREMPGFRTDRPGRQWVDPSTIVFAKLLPRGVQLIDGKIPADPQVAF
ncbi:MAG: hypothetical protein KGL39_11380 [Patescibacteria group bacterium]|nr:hypothetical protein [Patescibacteria group bacterium]